MNDTTFKNCHGLDEDGHVTSSYDIALMSKELLNKYPNLEAAAFAIVGWVGIKLLVIVLAHDEIALIPHDFPHGIVWQSIFWTVLLALVIIGWITSVRHNKKSS